MTPKFIDLIVQVRESEEADRLALETEKKTAKARKQSGKPKLIGFFNNAHRIGDLLVEANFDQDGCSDAYRHPNSKSGNFSCSVKIDAQGVERAHTLSPNDPLFLPKKGAHDAFSCFTVLFHAGNPDAALRAAGDLLNSEGGILAVGERSWNEQRQELADQSALDALPDYAADKGFSLTQFSLSGNSTKMRQQMLNDIFVLDRLALLGQATAFYSKPNVGKTLLILWLLIASIEAGNINPEDIFYINADDDFKGLVVKLELAEKHGFNMLAPGHNGFNSKDLVKHLQTLVANGTATGKIIILDTLKKFTEVMDKRTASDFMRAARVFISSGGTLLLLAHVNKNRDICGKVIFGGTSDIVDDCDCAFTLDEVGTLGTTKNVLFENLKMRGDVDQTAGYSYEIAQGMTYLDRLGSVQALNTAEVGEAKQAKTINEQMGKDKDLIGIITAILEPGDMLKTEIQSLVHRNRGFSFARIGRVLSDYAGTDYQKGDRWSYVLGTRNSQIYTLLKPEFEEPDLSIIE